MRTRQLFSLVAALALQPLLGAQLSQPGTPASSRFELASDTPSVFLTEPDLATLRAEDEARGPFPFRYGAVVPVSVGIETHGVWSEVAETGELVWRVEIRSPGAFSLGVLFDHFDIPNGSQVFLYDPARTQVLGAFTEINEQANGMLAIQPLAGDRLVIEYVQAAWVEELPALRVGEVIHDYRDILNSVELASRESALCFIDVNCPQGDPYQDIKRSVIEVFSGGGQCSAGLINNTAENGRPYFLVADHCGDMTNVVAIFNYERSGCSSGGSSQSQSLSGAVLRDRSPIYDSQLYELNNAPPQSYQPFFAGWGRGNSPAAPAVGIHHAQGQPKKISIDDQAPLNGGNMWIVQYDDGQVHGGSSGSPLFNERKRIIGPACCVSNFICGTQTTMYGRLDKFWNQDNLGEWLDPLETGRLGWDGYDPFNAQSIPYQGTNANPDVYTSTVPTLGSTWTATIDTSGDPSATSTYLVGYAKSLAAGQVFGYGELLVDLTSQRYFQRTRSVSGGQSVHTALIPNDPMFQGLVAHTQAFILGDEVQATNGVKLRLN